MADLAGWLDEWELVLRTGTVAEQSRVTYLRGVRQFLAHLDAVAPTVDEPGDITRRHVESWMRSLTEAGKSEGTRRIRLKTLRLWFNWLASESDSGVTSNPATAVALPAEQLKPVPVIPDDVLGRLLGTAGSTNFIDRRDAALIRLLIDTGMRRGELVAVDLDDLDMRHQEITIRRGKGGKARVVPYGSRTALALSRYVRSRAQHQASGLTPALFLALRPTANSGSPWRLSGDGVANMLERRCAVAGIPPINPHAFRHTWAHDLMAHGANESDVERLAGWSSPLMVRRYGNSAADARARDAHRRLARGDRL
jgi:integrase